MKLNRDSIFEAINLLVEDYHLRAEEIFEIAKAWIQAGFKKDFPEFKKADIVIDFNEAWEVRILRKWTIVEDVEDGEKQMDIDTVKKERGSDDVKEGELVWKEITPKNLELSRIASTTAAQTIKQELKKIEKEQIQSKFKDQEGKLIQGTITKVADNNILLEVNKNPIILPPEGQIPQKKYVEGDDIFVCIKSTSGKDGLPDVSESNPDFIKALLKHFFPEVEDGTITIEKIARRAGIRTKVLIKSNNPKIDAIGTMIGKDASRIQMVTNILNYKLEGNGNDREDWLSVSEKVEFIEWTDDKEELVRRCFKPLDLDKVVLKDNDKVIIYVAEDKKALAIGKKSSNVQTASDLVGCKIEIN